MNTHTHRAAIVYDFDGTLAPGNMQDYGFLPDLGLTPADFWRRVDDEAEEHNCDRVLAYLLRMLQEARERNCPITRESMARHGAKIPLFPGLEKSNTQDSWFTRMNGYARSRNLELEHYVISSGNREIINGIPGLMAAFRQIFASEYRYDEAGKAIWPATAINYTTKTQYLFRINKGIMNNWEDTRINRWVPLDERPVPFTRMIFIGDGETDIPCMKMVRHQGGIPIAVFDPSRREERGNIYRLIAEERTDFIAPADYRAGGQLESLVQGILGRFARDAGWRE